MKLSSIFAFALLIPSALHSQVTTEDYALADSAYKFNELVYNGFVNARPLRDSTGFWYTVRTRRGTEYKLIHPEKVKVVAAFDQEKLCAGINSQTETAHRPYDLQLRRLRFINRGKSITFELDGIKWECDLEKYKLENKGKAERENADRPYWGSTEGMFEREPVDSPDGKYTAFIREYNLVVRKKDSADVVQLSFDGSEGEFYSGHIEWSPDSRKIAVNKVRPHQKRYFYMVESSPDSQVQPILQKREYLKPGDALPIRKPCLFDMEKVEQIPVDTRSFEHQYQISNLKWWPDSRAFTFEFNQRGHQLYQVVEVNADNGETRILIEESSETFIDYSGKRYRYDLEDSGEIIWASERDGWNHLYLVDATTGEIKNRITSGEWVVRGVEYVDEENRRIIFSGSGKDEGMDPYFVHYYRVNLDGSGLTDLTPEPMHHRAVFSADHRFFTDTYSTVDTPPVTVLRRTADGALLAVLEKADIEELLKTLWRAPEVFVAKGRDGKTDIWGNIYYPTRFDPARKYPVIEYIYAGPQAAYTQKSFRPYMGQFTGLAELGFIIVQMDGMGTSYRSKAFQDVCYKNLKDAGFPDRILWIRAAAETRPFMDTTRIGLFGVSAGGQNAMAGVLFHPEFYKAAAASCGCHDNRMDKIWWNEQWMGYPVGKQYEESSNVVNAHLLQGELLLIVGELDDNVDPASTMQVVDALIDAEKDFELVVLPGVNHTAGGRFGELKRRDFFVKAFYKQLPPDRNSRQEAYDADRLEAVVQTDTDTIPEVGIPPEELGLDPFYRKYLDANGIPVVSSWRVPDSALVQAWKIISFMTSDIPPEVLQQMQATGLRVGVMARYEGTTDIPEHAHLERDTTLNWDVRARGLGGDPELPLTTCAEENLLCYQIDKYHAEDILIHEFAHSIHLVGIMPLDSTFNKRLQELLDQAIAEGKYEGTYARTNIYEYWAEGVQDWFNVNAEVSHPDGKHNQLNTRDELRNYDPGLYDLLRHYFSETGSSPSCHVSENRYPIK